MTDLPTARAALAELLRAGHSTLVFTGAGVSTASGIPDFRGPHGVWTTRTPVTYQEFLVSDEARRRYWQQKAIDWDELSTSRPNAVHAAIARLARTGRVNAVVTQNIDGLHAASGIDRRMLIELHGTGREAACLRCGRRSPIEEQLERFAVEGEPPRCGCGGWIKPATISFGQQLRRDDVERAFAAADAADLVVALGSTLSVTPAASIPLLAAGRGAPYAIVNHGPTDHDTMSAVTLRIEADLVDVVPAAVDAALAD